jgi:hypothetical protein
VLRTAARQKKAMNQGHWMRAFAFRLTAVARDSGTIHRARAHLTVVPTRSAAAPYFVAAPTTELVSWIARAAHHCEGDRQQGVKEATASSADYFVQIHSPNPRPTTESCSSNLEARAVGWGNGCRNSSPKESPAASTTGGDTNPLPAASKPSRNTMADVIVEKSRGRNAPRVRR